MESNRQLDRKNLLADIAELYFVEGKNQSEIAQVYGMTRSNVSPIVNRGSKFRNYYFSNQSPYSRESPSCTRNHPTLWPENTPESLRSIRLLSF